MSEARASIRFLVPNGENGVEFVGSHHAVYALANFLNAVPSFLAPIADKVPVLPQLLIQRGNQIFVCPVSTPFIATFGEGSQVMNVMAAEMLESLKQSFDADTLSFVLKLDEDLFMIH